MNVDTNPEATDPYSEEVDEILELQKSDPVGAFKALKALAPRSVNAMLELGLAHSRGRGTATDTAAAEACYRRAAEAGSPTATFNLGVLSEKRGSYPQALEFYARAAALGKPDAQQAWFNVRVGEAQAVARTDPARAHVAYRALADQGSVQGMIRLAWTYNTGSGTDEDSDQAEYWYQRAFNEGSGYFKAEAAYYLGIIYQQREDYAKAREMYQYGCDRDHADAIQRMGQLYANGLGVEQDPHKARSLYEQAENLGSVFALRDLAWQDLSGRFGLINFFRGIPRLLRAARKFDSVMEQRGDRWVVTSKTKKVHN